MWTFGLGLWLRLVFWFNREVDMKLGLGLWLRSGLNWDVEMKLHCKKKYVVD